MVTREESFSGVRNPSQLCQLLKMPKGRVFSSKSSLSSNASYYVIANSNTLHPAPRFYAEKRAEITLPHEVAANEQPCDQPLDFSIKKSLSRTNGSSKSTEFHDDARPCFIPSPCPPENSNSSFVHRTFLPEEENVVSFLPPLPGSESLPVESSSIVVPMDNSSQLKIMPTLHTERPRTSESPVYSSARNPTQMTTGIDTRHSVLTSAVLPLANVTNNVTAPNTGSILETVPLPLSISPTMGNEHQKHASKYVRPFKAYPRDLIKSPMSYYGYQQAFTSSYGSSIDPEIVAREGILAKISEQKYQVFREIFKAERKSTEHKRNLNTIKTNKSSTGDVNSHNDFSGDHSNSSLSANNDSPNGTVGSSDDVNQHLSAICQGSSSAEKSDAAKTTAEGSNGVSESLQNWTNNTTENQTDCVSQSRKKHPNGRTSSGDGFKDEAYWERRRKNNEAAKRSRDARRQKEDEITIRATFLEHENRLLRMELAALKSENERLKCQFYSPHGSAATNLPPTQFLGLEAHAS